MKSSELVNELRKLLPPKVDYAKLVCAEPFSYGCCYVWEDPEPYIIENAANVIESQQAEIDRLKKENVKLRELVRLAVEDIQALALGMRDSDDTRTQIGCCFACRFDEGNREYSGAECPGYDIDDCFKWQHADKLKELGVEV